MAISFGAQHVGLEVQEKVHESFESVYIIMNLRANHQIQSWNQNGVMGRIVFGIVNQKAKIIRKLLEIDSGNVREWRCIKQKFNKRYEQIVEY